MTNVNFKVPHCQTATLPHCPNCPNCPNKTMELVKKCNTISMVNMMPCVGILAMVVAVQLVRLVKRIKLASLSHMVVSTSTYLSSNALVASMVVPMLLSGLYDMKNRLVSLLSNLVSNWIAKTVVISRAGRASSFGCCCCQSCQSCCSCCSFGQTDQPDVSRLSWLRVVMLDFPNSSVVF